MIPLCNFCNNEIIGRHHLAKICFECLDKTVDKTGAIAAINAVKQAVKKGILASVKTLLCVDCGKNAQCYDHRDYNKPLEVAPVCRSCNFKRGLAIPLDMTNVKVVKRPRKNKEESKFLFTSLL